MQNKKKIITVTIAAIIIAALVYMLLIQPAQNKNKTLKQQAKTAQTQPEITKIQANKETTETADKAIIETIDITKIEKVLQKATEENNIKIVEQSFDKQINKGTIIIYGDPQNIMSFPISMTSSLKYTSSNQIEGDGNILLAIDKFQSIKKELNYQAVIDYHQVLRTAASPSITSTSTVPNTNATSTPTVTSTNTTSTPTNPQAPTPQPTATNTVSKTTP